MITRVITSATQPCTPPETPPKVPGQKCLSLFPAFAQMDAEAVFAEGHAFKVNEHFLRFALIILTFLQNVVYFVLDYIVAQPKPSRECSLEKALAVVFLKIPLGLKGWFGR